MLGFWVGFCVCVVRIYITLKDFCRQSGHLEKHKSMKSYSFGVFISPLQLVFARKANVIKTCMSPHKNCLVPRRNT